MRKSYEELEAREAELEKQVFGKETPQEPKPEVAQPAEAPDGIKDETATVEKDATATPIADNDGKETPTPDKDEQTYKAKYDTLKGKYDKETPRAIREANAAKAEAKQFKEYAEELQKRIAQLETDAKAKEVAAGSKSIDDLVGVYPEIAEALKAIKTEHEAKIAALRDEFKHSVDSEIAPIKHDLQESKEERFDRIIREAGVPEWRQIDGDENFIAWLGEQVPYTSKTRLDLLRESAKDYRDPYTTAQFFKDYKATLAPASKEDVQEKLRKYVAPPKSSTATTPGRGAQPTVSRADYHRFMDLSARGLFDPKDWGGKSEAQVEAMFDKAILERRIA